MSLEESEIDGDSVTNAVLKLSESRTVFGEMTSGATRYYKKLKKTVVLPLMIVNIDSPFIVSNKVTDFLVFRVCRTSMTIEKPNCETHVI